MIGAALAVVRKDLRLAFANGQGPVQAVLFGLLLVFLFSLSAAPGEYVHYNYICFLKVHS